MCGYFNDRGPESLAGENYYNQLSFVLEKYKELLENEKERIQLPGVDAIFY